MTDEAPTLLAGPHTIRGDNRTVVLVMPRVSGGKRDPDGITLDSYTMSIPEA